MDSGIVKVIVIKPFTPVRGEYPIFNSGEDGNTSIFFYFSEEELIEYFIFGKIENIKVFYI